jgi:uncharacterized membrane protein YhaH (DUF805 family)
MKQASYIDTFINWDTNGRATRSEFWTYAFVNFLVSISIFVLSRITENQFFSVGFAIISFFPSIAVSIRRLHDSGNSGWNVLWGLPIVNLIGIFILIYMYCLPSDDDNQYGEDPNQEFKINKIKEKAENDAKKVLNKKNEEELYNEFYQQALNKTETNTKKPMKPRKRRKSKYDDGEERTNRLIEDLEDAPDWAFDKLKY